MSATPKPDLDLPVKLFKHQKAWEIWLAQHFDSSAGLWLQLAKKQAKLQSLTYPEALEVALCYGWIDGQKKRYDEVSWLQKFTPRGPRRARTRALCLCQSSVSTSLIPTRLPRSQHDVTIRPIKFW